MSQAAARARAQVLRAAIEGRTPIRQLPGTCEYCGTPTRKGNDTRDECPNYVIDQAAEALAKEENHGDEPVPAAP